MVERDPKRWESCLSLWINSLRSLKRWRLSSRYGRAVFLSVCFVVDLLLGKRRDDNPDTTNFRRSPLYIREILIQFLFLSLTLSLYAFFVRNQFLQWGLPVVHRLSRYFYRHSPSWRLLIQFNTFVLILSLFIIIMPISSRYKTATIPNPNPESRANPLGRSPRPRI